jgi:hypothetical protein
MPQYLSPIPNVEQPVVAATVGAAIATTAATNSSPYGFSQAQADQLIARVNALRVDVLAITDALQDLGYVAAS